MQGRCLCGEIEFEFDGPISGIELCHCSRCRRSTGSAFAAGFYVNPAKFRWTKGENMISVYEAPILRNPPAYRVSFCRNCGSEVPTVRAGASVISIPAGLVEGQLDARISDQIFMGLRASWFNPTELSGVPSYEAGPSREFREQMQAMVK
jgi:hypothetical protein